MTACRPSFDVSISPVTGYQVGSGSPLTVGDYSCLLNREAAYLRWKPVESYNASALVRLARSAPRLTRR